MSNIGQIFIQTPLSRLLCVINPSYKQSTYKYIHEFWCVYDYNFTLGLSIYSSSLSYWYESFKYTYIVTVT